MNRILALTFAISLASIIPVRAEGNRFYRLLALYEGRTYRTSDRDLVIDLGYNSKSTDVNPPRGSDPSETGDRIRTFDRNADDNLGVEAEWYSGDSLRSRELSLSAGLAGFYDDTSYRRDNDLLGKSDISAQTTVQQGLYLTGMYDFERYRHRKKPGKYWFYGFQIPFSIRAQGRYEAVRDQSELSQINAGLTKWKTGLADATVRIVPEIGFGRPKPVIPLYRALETERSLKEAGIIRQDLPDSTVIAIARWIATEFAVINTRDRGDVRFYEGLDSILASDSALTGGRLSAYSVLSIREKINRDLPWLENGFKVSLQANATINLRYDYQRYESNTASSRQESQWDGFEFNQESSILLLNLFWGWAITPNIFLSVNGEGGALARSEEGIGDPFERWGILNCSWGLSLYYLVTDRWYARAAMEGLPTDYLIVPADQPALLGLSLNYFIEDRTTLAIELDRTWSDLLYYYPSYYGSVFKQTARVKTADAVIRLELRHDF